jgi:predicted nucleic acid-binding protein
VTCCDTSFLYSLYGGDAHSPRAITFLRHIKKSVSISELNRFELANALRLASFRKLLSVAQRDLFLEQFERDVLRGLLSIQITNLADVLAEAGRISESHTPKGGHRGFDILHVAAATKIGATDFLTFDRNQRNLARAVGLKVPL